MAKWLMLMLLAATPFWETAQPEEWTEEQLIEFFQQSPWVQPAEAAQGQGVQTFLATAAPVQAAELELRRRRIKKLPGGEAPVDPAWEEYREFLERDGGKYIVLAVAIPVEATQEAEEMALMENQSVMKLGKRKVKMSGYFPPSSSDPYTRLIFPRGGTDEVKELVFELFLPGTGTPYRTAVYPRKQLSYRGAVAM
jgi:hypothetical protein